jgi:hypothetical protein
MTSESGSLKLSAAYHAELQVEKPGCHPAWENIVADGSVG